jgi:hypothetical protein
MRIWSIMIMFNANYVSCLTVVEQLADTTQRFDVDQWNCFELKMYFLTFSIHFPLFWLIIRLIKGDQIKFSSIFIRRISVGCVLLLEFIFNTNKSFINWYLEVQQMILPVISFLKLNILLFSWCSNVDYTFMSYLWEVNCIVYIKFNII